MNEIFLVYCFGEAGENIKTWGETGAERKKMGPLYVRACVCVCVLKDKEGGYIVRTSSQQGLYTVSVYSRTAG